MPKKVPEAKKKKHLLAIKFSDEELVLFDRALALSDGYYRVEFGREVIMKYVNRVIAKWGKDDGK